jgi:hypothetical protein
MKTIFLTILVCFFFVQISQAQWQPDVRLTNDPALSSTTQNTNARCFASIGDTLGVVWYDTRDGASPEIYYKRSIDGGINWGSDTRLTNNIYFSSNPSVSVSGSNVHIVWQDNRDGNYEIYYKRSTDGGTSWGADIRLTNDSSPSRYPCVEVSNLFVHVVWHDWNTLDIFYKRSTDGGLNWEANILLTIDTVITNWPSLYVSSSNVHVLWMDSRDDNLHSQIYYKHSTDGGINWEADTRLTTNYTSATLFSTIAVSGSNVHVVWDDNRDGNYEIYYKHSTDGGLSWGADTRLTNNVSFSMHPYLSSSDLAVHVVWTDNRDVNTDIYYKRNPTGNVTGIENISSELPEEFNLDQNYPNPFNPSTSIQYAINNKQFVALKVYDLLGREVATLVDEYKSAGTYEVKFDAAQISSGIYFYKLQAGSFISTKKMILIK